MKFWILAAAAAAQAGVQAPEPTAPTPIEHALVEYLCRTTQAALPGTTAYGICYDAQLTALRQGFGRDLTRLSDADRKTMDAACGPLQDTRGRDAYLGCVNEQLTATHARRNAGRGGTPAPPAPDGPDGASPAPPSEDPQPAAPAAEAPSPLSVIWWLVGFTAIGAVATAGAVLALKKAKPAAAVACRSCGADVHGAGDLCAACRHEAAEARRRAAADRTDDSRAQVDAARRFAEEQQELERREQQRRDDEARRHADDEVRRQDELARRLRLDEERRQREASAGDFDPYVVLGLPPGAGREAIRAAYEQARAKYAPSEYEHLGAELQEHFKAKAQAVERAYQLLAETAL